MSTLVDAAEHRGDHSLLSLVSICQRVDFVVHLQLVFLTPFVIVFLMECLKSWGVILKQETKLSSYLGYVERTIDMAFIVIVKEGFDLVG